MRQVEEEREFQRSSWQLACELQSGEPRWISPLWMITGWSRKGQGSDEVMWEREESNCELATESSSGEGSTVTQRNWTLSPMSHNVQELKADAHSVGSSTTYWRSLIRCVNGNWNPLIRKPKWLDLHLSCDWMMSQTLGVGFTVTLLQSWLILIIINAILECKPWYYKAKVIHLWSVKCQIILFLKIVMKFAVRHLAKHKGQSLVERQGARCSITACFWGSGAQPGSQLCGRGYFHRCHSQCVRALAPAFGLALFGDIWIWLYVVFGTCAVDCSVLCCSLWKYE